MCRYGIGSPRLRHQDKLPRQDPITGPGEDLDGPYRRGGSLKTDNYGFDKGLVSSIVYTLCEETLHTHLGRNLSKDNTMGLGFIGEWLYLL